RSFAPLGNHTGRSAHGRTSRAVRNSLLTHVGDVGVRAWWRAMRSAAHTSSAADNNAPSDTLSGALTALKTPPTPLSRSPTLNLARSRTSTHCSGSDGVPGANSSPPPATRLTQYVKRSVGSYRPTTSPGLMMVRRSPAYRLETTCSHWALSGP